MLVVLGACGAVGLDAPEKGNWTVENCIVLKMAAQVGFCDSVAEFKEFERRFKFKPQLKYGWFHLKLYQMFQDLSLRLI